MITRTIKQLDAIEILIRQGDHSSARIALNDIPTRQVEREHMARFAAHLRRSGLVNRAIRALNPIVRDPTSLAQPNAYELLEYATSLTAIGANHEAQLIFNSIEPSKFPEALLYSTFALTPEWRYAETIAPLRQFLSLDEVPSYLQLVGLVNLIAALIYCDQLNEADILLQSTISRAKENKNWFLLGSLYELSAQCYLNRKNYSDAASALQKAHSILVRTGSTAGLYVEKWQTILNFLRSNAGQAEGEQLSRLRSKALKSDNWEIVRDCDFYLIKANSDPHLFQYLYAGSPIVSFRQRLHHYFPELTIPCSPYLWQISGKLQASHRVLNSATACLGESPILEPGQAPHRLLMALCQDFYRPQRIARLASQIFIGELYHPLHTHAKMHQIVVRLRAALSQYRIPLRLEVKGGLIGLRGIRNCTILKEWIFDSVPLTPSRLGLYSVLRKFPTQTFSTQEAAKILGCAVSTASRKLEVAVTEGIYKRTGAGRATRFQLIQNETA